MGKAVRSVEELVAAVERGELRLPEMQRRYVWRATRVRDLLDSLYRGYPSGTILVWETGDEVPTRAFAVQQSMSPYRTSQLLLDGQQRLTSLSAVLRGESVNVRFRKRPIDILFNLEHPDELAQVMEVEEEGEENGEEEEADLDDDEAADASEDDIQKRLSQLTFVVAAKRLAQLSNWVSVTDVFRNDSDAPFLKKAGVRDFEDSRYHKYTQRLANLRAIRKYEYNVHVLEQKLSYEEVTEIFVRVNSLGAKLRSSDLALAQITAKWRNALETFEAFQNECGEAGFDVELGIHLKNLVTFATNQSRFKTVGRLPVETLQKAWAHAQEGMHFAINFLKSNVGINSPILLSSPFLMIAVAYLGHQRNYKLSKADAAKLKYWLLVANARGRYSRGSSETILDQDLSTIANGKEIESLIDLVKQQFGRLEITPDDLVGRNQRSGLFKTMFLVFRDEGATDWNSNLRIDLNHKGKQHRLQFHHIFPKAVLKDKYKPRDVNDIANLAFIGGRTNRSISDKAPAKYFEAILDKHGSQPFDSQSIPTSHQLLTVESYPDFLEERRRLIAGRINGYLERLYTDSR